MKKYRRVRNSTVLILTSFLALVCLPLLAGAQSLREMQSDLEKLKKERSYYYNIVNNDNIICVLMYAGNYQSHMPRCVDKNEFINETIKRAFDGESRQLSKQEFTSLFGNAFKYSYKHKDQIKRVLIPNLEQKISFLKNEINGQKNAGNQGPWGGGNSSSNSGYGTPIKDAQMGTFDGNWSDATSNYYSSCPKKQPDNRSSFRAYPNGKTSGNTYRECAYFKRGGLQREVPYVNGKRHGLQTFYLWSDNSNVHYASSRFNFSNGKRNGLSESYSVTRNGAVYRMWLKTYSNGDAHGDGAQWYDNGQTEKDQKFFNGKLVYERGYRRDGSTYSCRKSGADGVLRDCKTGKP